MLKVNEIYRAKCPMYIVHELVWQIVYTQLSCAIMLFKMIEKCQCDSIQ